MELFIITTEFVNRISLNAYKSKAYNRNRIAAANTKWVWIILVKSHFRRIHNLICILTVSIKFNLTPCLSAITKSGGIYIRNFFKGFLPDLIYYKCSLLFSSVWPVPPIPPSPEIFSSESRSLISCISAFLIASLAFSTIQFLKAPLALGFCKVLALPKAEAGGLVFARWDELFAELFTNPWSPT